jgi:hypothetical protein
MKRVFVEDPEVLSVLDANGVSDAQVLAMQHEIMRGAGNTVSGTGGLKKIRCGAEGRGKSGGVRVIFADYPAAGTAFLPAAFGKNEKADLTPGERDGLKKVKRVLDRRMAGRGGL